MNNIGFFLNGRLASCNFYSRSSQQAAIFSMFKYR